MPSRGAGRTYSRAPSTIRVQIYRIRMRKRVVTVGTSAAVTLSREELFALSVSPGESVEVTCRDGAGSLASGSPSR